MSDFFEPDTVYIKYADPYKAPELVPEFWCVDVLQHPTDPDVKFALGWGRWGHGDPWEPTPMAFEPKHFDQWGHVSPYDDPKRVFS